MRELTDHKVAALNQDLQVITVDEPADIGGANHEYDISYCLNPGTAAGGTSPMLRIKFQKGIVPESGINGITIEALMAICIDRIRGFQSGEFACRENAIALTKLEEALMWLQKRTIDRIRRGVEGTFHK